jgi:hypothetical protein
MHSKRCVRRIFRLGMVAACLLLAITSMLGQNTTATLQDSTALLQAQLRAQQLELERLKDHVKSLEAVVGALKSEDEPRINPTDGVVPYRANARTFADSPLFVDVNGNLGFGLNPTAPLGNNALTIVGTSDPDGDAGSIEIHNNFAQGIDLYVHDPNNTAFRAPILDMYKSEGTQQSPVAVKAGDYIGYPASIYGWDGSDWGLGFQVQVLAVENFTPSDHSTNTVFAATDGLSNQRYITIGSNRVVLWRPVNFSGTGIAPASSGAAGTKGDFAWDDNYLYLCVETNSWKRVPLTTW